MARPLKSGLDYFPLDVYFEDSVELIEAEYGLEGFAILIKLWQKIYANGYYINWNSDTELLFSKKINSSINAVSSVVNSCLLRNLFNNNLYEKYGVLTSLGIQKRYLSACVACKRKNIIMEKNLYLLGEDQKKLITEFIELIPEETPVNSGESTQKKRKEKKGEENKGEENKDTTDGEENSFEFFSKNIGPITPFQAEFIESYINDEVEEKLIILILQESIGKSDPWSWFKKVLENSFKQNVKTIEQYESKKVERKQEWEKKHTSSKSNFKPANAANFEQRQYDDSYFDSLYENSKG